MVGGGCREDVVGDAGAACQHSGTAPIMLKGLGLCKGSFYTPGARKQEWMKPSV